MNSIEEGKPVVFSSFVSNRKVRANQVREAQFFGKSRKKLEQRAIQRRTKETEQTHFLLKHWLFSIALLVRWHTSKGTEISFFLFSKVNKTKFNTSSTSLFSSFLPDEVQQSCFEVFPFSIHSVDITPTTHKVQQTSKGSILIQRPRLVPDALSSLWFAAGADAIN